jgi:hypothetical protein
MKNRRTVKRSKRSRRSKKTKGGGYSDGPNFVNPGNLVHNQYAGYGKDCTGNPMSIRPGYIFNYTPKGLPGFAGGAWGKKNRKNRRRGGAAMPNAATTDLPGPVPNPNMLPVAGSLTPKPGDFPDTTGAGGSVAQPNVVMSMPGVPTPGAAQMPKVQLDSSASAQNLAAPKQAGGRYGFFPGMGPLNPVNGVGVAPAPFGRIPCETGSYNPLNPNPDNIQRLSTAPLTPPFVTKPFSGGGGLPAGSGLAASAANFPVVKVGDFDSMRYYAPTAGYRNDFMTFRAPSPVPGLTIQTPYDARAFNQACIKTGGSRKNKSKSKSKSKSKKNKKHGGAAPVALDAGPFTPVTMSEIWTRKDFDGSDKLLPVKFGGKRKTRRGHKKQRKSRKN